MPAYARICLALALVLGALPLLAGCNTNASAGPYVSTGAGATIDTARKPMR